jgi:hypothetical protein
MGIEIPPTPLRKGGFLAFKKNPTLIIKIGALSPPSQGGLGRILI